jgi:hypothetical protein
LRLGNITEPSCVCPSKENARPLSFSEIGMMYYVPWLTASVKSTLRDRINYLDGEIAALVFEVHRSREEIEENERDLAHLKAERDEIESVLEAAGGDNVVRLEIA